MATYITQFYTTQAGTRIVADAIQNNQTVTFVRGQIGTGQPSSADDVPLMTQLVTPKYDMKVQKVGPNVSFPPATFGIDLIIDSRQVAETTQMTEIGLFAQVGSDTSTETLFAYGYSTTPEELISGSELTYQSHRLIDTLISTTANVTVNVQSIVNPSITVNNIQDVDGNITLVASDIPTDDSDVQTELDNIKDKNTQQDTAISNINSKITSIEGDINNIEGDINDINNTINNMKTTGNVMKSITSDYNTDILNTTGQAFPLTVTSGYSGVGWLRISIYSNGDTTSGRGVFVPCSLGGSDAQTYTYTDMDNEGDARVKIEFDTNQRRNGYLTVARCKAYNSSGQSINKVTFNQAFALLPL